MVSTKSFPFEFDDVSDESRTSQQEVKSFTPPPLDNYHYIGTLGVGGQGSVFLYKDIRLQRKVAIKFLHSQADVDLEKILSEAKLAAKLRHDNIPEVYDVHTSQPFHIITAYIEGSDLRSVLSESTKLDYRQAAEICRTIADVLSLAHRHKIIHRDVKPANIIIDDRGQPHLLDFGLAITELQRTISLPRAGTASYMSPEQARSDWHRIDGRSDIFSLGVVLYEMLTGERPFKGSTVSEVIDRIGGKVEAFHVRQLDDAIPVMLGNICETAIRKKPRERYSTAADLIADLDKFLASDDLSVSQESSISRSAIERQQPAKQVYRGFRSYGQDDKDFFLDFIPGQRDTSNLPVSVANWKEWVESPAASNEGNCQMVGCVCGPSGSGKSSFLKAALLPSLNHDLVDTIYVEADRDNTCQHLKRELAKKFAGLNDLTLPEAIENLRSKLPNGRKVLIVIDQFEQWLHHLNDADTEELIDALRKCDGKNVQCIVAARSDFYVSFFRFFREIDVRLDEDQNYQIVDLFDENHAYKILRIFAESLDKVDGNDQIDGFLRKAVKGLATQGHIICVQLVVFAEMMKSRDWTEENLEEMGGPDGVGVAYLKSQFSNPTALKAIAPAAKRVLRKLLPTTDIFDQGRTRSELLGESGLQEHPGEFDELMRNLSRKLRLVTDMDPAEDDLSKESGEKLYRLAHEYLIPPVREWLRQEVTPAEQSLHQLSTQWHDDKSDRFLPTTDELKYFRGEVNPAALSKAEKQFLDVASKFHKKRRLWRWAMVLSVLVPLAFAGLYAWSTANQRTQQTAAINLQESYFGVEIDSLDDKLKEVRRLSPRYSDFVEGLIRARFKRDSTSTLDKLRASLLLMPDDEALKYFCSNLHQVSDLASLRALAKACTHSERVSKTCYELLTQQPIDSEFAAPGFAWAIVDPEALAAFLQNQTTSSRQRRAVLFSLENLRSIAHESESLTTTIAELYRNDPDAGVHSASWWLLKSWNDTLPPNSETQITDDATWLISDSRTPYSVVRLDEPAPNAAQQFAIGMTEVTYSDFNEFFIQQTELNPGRESLFKWLARKKSTSKSPFQENLAFILGYSGTDKARGIKMENCPQSYVSWHMAALYCNWLSEQEEFEPCFRRVGTSNDGIPVMEMRPNYFKLSGYRLPSTQEWQHASGGGANTIRHYGDDAERLSQYAWYADNSKDRIHPVASLRPNQFGLFDSLGNVCEWCCEEGPPVDDQVEPREQRGGSAFYPANQTTTVCEAADSSGKWERADHGFRVVRTLLDAADD